MNISNRVNQLKKSAIHEMTRLSKEIDDVSFLSWAKPTTDTPEHIKEAAISAIRNGLVGGYSPTDGLVELRQEIVKKLKRDNNINADISQLLITVGAIEGLAAAVMAIIDPGDEVILPTPTYSTHIRQVQIASGRPVLVPLIEENDFALDIQAIKNAITPRTKAIMYCSPNNPTGTVFPEEQLRKIAEIALENNLMIITDEAYEYFIYDDEKHFSIGSIPEMKKNVISCFTFTKTYAMTGWRLAYLAAPANLVKEIAKLLQNTSVCANSITQRAGLAAIQGSQECVFKNVYSL